MLHAINYDPFIVMSVSYRVEDCKNEKHNFDNIVAIAIYIMQ